ncbi:G-D-S-L family lipolytic protein [Neobacillus bataviensis LMG 21833]|uniref:G-D-S-L family lipolytic protein n=1 Tax=Neobacillus bataviensis LMG 21833 TaxID=1117379 RepID=K6DA56_9BACI|nr:SGNH/GDSL hydrolase family protein [Neobacillus bataviensis]EKN65194.1 G-D-S-L family lipolytic protein [Neobacillus bataviensis LMG 21833]
MKQIELDDRIIHGAISLEHKGEYVKPWRINYKEKDFYTPNQLNGQAEVPAGVRISFLSNTDKIKLEIAPSPLELEFDILIDNELFRTIVVDANKTFLEAADLPNQTKRLDIYLSQRNKVELKALWIAEDASFQPFNDTRKKWMTYGSSITQCYLAESPSQTWPAITAKELDLNLVCLGYSGECQYEPMTARMIRDTSVDFIHLNASINSYNAETYNHRTFQAVVIGFIKIIREKHKNVPIVLSSSIYGAHRETTENIVGFTLAQMRDEVEEVINIFRKNGDERIFYINGLDIFGAEHGYLLPDNLHPNAEGYKLMGQNFANAFKPYIK